MSGIPTTERFSRESAGTDSSGSPTQQAAERAQQKAQEGAEKAKGAVRTQVDERSTQIGEQLGTHASDARTIAEELRKQGKDGPAKAAEQAAERVERVGGYLQQSDADRILSDVENYARQNPWAVVAGGLAAGFLASRFVKASTQQRQVSASTTPRRELPQPPAATPARPAEFADPAPAPAPPAGTGGMTDGVGTTSVPGRPTL
ncbi:MAG TPA: hypothetical protein VD931_06920 [Baekduia sp.]|nr:hypothetical protein [Baekduia sp.]